jgi:hypothetical protein
MRLSLVGDIEIGFALGNLSSWLKNWAHEMVPRGELTQRLSEAGFAKEGPRRPRRDRQGRHASAHPEEALDRAAAVNRP